MSRGLVFFATETPQRLKRARVLFVLVVLVAATALVWPVFAWVAKPFPLLLGLPLPFAWVIGWLTVVFVALVALYRVEHRS